MDDKVKYEQPSKDCMNKAEQKALDAFPVHKYAFGAFIIDLNDSSRRLFIQAYELAYNSALEEIGKELDKWKEHAVRGMKEGNPVYFQGRIALIEDIEEWIKSNKI